MEIFGLPELDTGLKNERSSISEVCELVRISLGRHLICEKDMALAVLYAAERDEEVIEPCIEKRCINICVYRLSVLYALVAEVFEVGILLM